MEGDQGVEPGITLFFDQNIGPGVPRILRELGPREFNYRALVDEYPDALRRGQHVDDVEWLPRVGERGWLAITRDLRILVVADERRALIEGRARVVFLRPGNSPRRAMASFVVSRQAWLQRIYDEVPPPFACIVQIAEPIENARFADLST